MKWKTDIEINLPKACSVSDNKFMEFSLYRTQNGTNVVKVSGFTNLHLLKLAVDWVIVKLINRFGLVHHIRYLGLEVWFKGLRVSATKLATLIGHSVNYCI